MAKPISPDWSEHEAEAFFLAEGEVKRKAGKNLNVCTTNALQTILKLSLKEEH